MSLFAGITQMGRTIAEARMESVCVIRRQTGTTTDHGTGVDTPVWSVVYAALPCSFKFANGQPNEVDAAGQQVSTQHPVLSLPVTGSELVRVDDVAEITANSLDGALVGLRVRVDGMHSMTHATARRLPVVVVS